MTRSTFLSEGSWRKAWARPKRGSSGAEGTTEVEKTEALGEPMMCEEREARRDFAMEAKEDEDEDEGVEADMMKVLLRAVT